jgi:uncharacterized protein
MSSATLGLRPLQILILSDGRPGHYHLSEGVAAAIARRRPVAIDRLVIRKPRWLPGAWLAALVQGRTIDRLLARLLGAASGPASADLVISAGGDTLAANVLAARRLGAANVYCGTLRRLDPGHFSLIVTSYARHATRPRHLVCLKPSGFDPDAIEDRRRQRGEATTPQTAGLLIGGDSGHFRFEAADWQRLTAFVIDAHVRNGIRWIVSTSRRSSDAIADTMASLAARPNGPIAEFIDFRTAGPGTLPRVFESVDAIVCTEDSSTMITEAVCAKLPVVGVAPTTHGFKDEEAEYRGYLRDQGWCRYVPLDQLSPSRFLAELERIRPLDENHLDRLADALQERLPQLFG